MNAEFSSNNYIVFAIVSSRKKIRDDCEELWADAATFLFKGW